MRRIGLLALTCMAGSLASAATIESTQLTVPTISVATLVQESDLIILATITDVSVGVGGTRLARAAVTASWKGHPDQVVEFVSSPSWPFDSFAPAGGERAVLFLHVSKSGQLAIHESGCGHMPLQQVGREQLATSWGNITFPGLAVRTLSEPKRRLFTRGIEMDSLQGAVANAREQARRAHRARNQR